MCDNTHSYQTQHNYASTRVFFFPTFFLSMLRPVCGSCVLQAIRPRPPATAAVGAREGD